MCEVVVVGGYSGKHLAIRVSRELGIGYISVYTRRFPDNELYVRVDGCVKDRIVIYINSLQPDPSERVIETLYTLYTLRDLGARKVYAFIPYMAYARQDQRFMEGEAISIEILAKLFRDTGVNGIYTVDMHLHRISDPRTIFGEKFHNLTAVPLLARYIMENYRLENPIIVGPDEEAVQWARVMAEIMGTDYTVLVKKRVSDEEVVIETRGADVCGRDVVIVDDIISTGGTMARAMEALWRLGARNVLVSCVHALLVGNALEKIMLQKPLDMIATDTVLSPITRVSIASLIAKTVKEEIIG